MKKIMPFLTALLMAAAAKAQTSRELIGKRQLVKLTQNGMEKDILQYFKSDKVYRAFTEDGKFQRKVGNKSSKGKWKLSKDNTQLTVTADLIPVKFSVDYFDNEKRLITNRSVYWNTVKSTSSPDAFDLYHPTPFCFTLC